MEEHTSWSRHALTVTVEVSPAEIFAGRDMTVRVKLSCSGGCDLRGQKVVIRDGDAVLSDGVRLTEFDGTTVATPEFVLQAPVVAGACTWSAEMLPQETADDAHREASAPFSFSVRPHTTHVASWGSPSAIVAGGTFTINVGIRCSLGCSMTGAPFEIYDHAGTPVASGAAGAEAWPGTTALHFARVELSAPRAVGYSRWEARFPEWGADMPHDAGAYTFGIKTVGAPECKVTVVAIDEEKQTPIVGAHVLLHPFRALTDERGVAELRVPEGKYELYVSGFKFTAFHATVEVTEDVTTRAELAVEAEETGYEHYY